MRITVPSWVMPGTYAENLRFLADQPEISGVELLFFIYDDEMKEMLRKEWDEIQSFADRFTYTVHLPDHILPEHGELVERFLPITRSYVVHPYPAAEAESQKPLLDSWAASWGNRGSGPEDLGALSPFLVENIYPGCIEALLPLLPPDTGLVMDTGHLVLEDRNPADYFRGNRERVKEIHFHGVDKEAAARDNRLQDHRSLRGGDPWFQELVPLLADYEGIVNLEVFSWEEVKASIETLRGAGLVP